jgi:predicted RecA/RadA family phage recombinase
MKNLIQQGVIVMLTAPENLTSGRGVQVGNMFSVAGSDAANGTTFEGQVTGVFELPKVSAQAWTQGALIYWDNTAKNCTTTVGTNLKIGVAIAVAANPSSTGRVRLNGAF